MQRLHLMLCALFLLQALPFCGQENAVLLQKIDSLKKVRTNSFKQDTALFKIYVSIGRACQKLLRLEEGKKYVDSALRLSIALGYKRGEAEAYNTMAVIKSKEEDFDSAFIFSKKSLGIFEALGDTVDIAVPLMNIGKNYADRGDYFNGLAYFKRAAAYNERAGKKALLASVFIGMGDMYENKGDFDEALLHYLKALKIYEKIKDKPGIATSYLKVGIVYNGLNNMEEALAYQQKALAIRIEMGDKRAIASSYINLAKIYTTQKRMPEALAAAQKGLEIAKEGGSKVSIGIAYDNIGVIYQESGNYAKALEYYLMEMKIYESVKKEDGLAFTYNNLGAVSLDLKKYKDAEIYLKKALESAEKIGDKFSIARANGGLAELYSITGDFKKALAAFKQHILYRDSVNNEENTKKTVQAQMQYDFDKKSAADSIRNAEAKRAEETNHQSEIRNQKLYTYAGLGGFVIMIVIAGISFIAFRNKKKATVEIQRQKLIVEEKQKEILDSIYYARRIQRALITNEKYISRNLRRLRG